jgi:trk system potassium uptake protein
MAFVMRFGVSTLPTPSMGLQDGDQAFMLVTDEIAATVRKITGATPEERKG